MPDTLVFDLSNLAYICAHRMLPGSVSQPDADKYLLVKLEDTMRQIYMNFSPKHVFFACDARDGVYWRHKIFPEYKANRKPSELKTLVRAVLEQFIAKNSKLCLREVLCEADDIIYAMTEHLEGSMVIVSTDSDFLQLISSKVKIYNPMARKFRVHKDSREYFLFIKSMRGDKVDNIPSAYPYVTTKKLNQAFADQNKLEQLLNTIISDTSDTSDTTEQVQGAPRQRLVKSQFALNQQLIDLAKIPAAVALDLSKVLEQVCDDLFVVSI